METTDTQFLNTEFARRLENNPRYSLRAFAKALKVNPGTLSGLLQGKRKLTLDAAQKLCGELGYSPQEKSQVLNRLNDQRPSTVLEHSVAFKLDEEIFRAISDWYHYGILGLVSLDHYSCQSSHKEPSWFAKELGIKPSEARLALDRLIQINLLRKDQEGFYRRTPEKVSTKDKSKSNGALKKWQRQLRTKAIEAIDEVPLERRSMTSMSMSTDPEKLAQAKVLIDRFQKELCQLMESGPQKEVYQLTVSLFPLQKNLENKGNQS